MTEREALFAPVEIAESEDGVVAKRGKRKAPTHYRDKDAFLGYKVGLPVFVMETRD